MTRKAGKVIFALLAYNHGSFIEQCIRSLADQTYRNFSVVFVDDGSTDATFETGKRLLREAGIDATCIQSHDNGICRNLNLALRSCGDGEFFTLFSSDDWLYPQSLEERVHFLNRHPGYAMVYAPVMLYWEEEGRLEYLKKPYAEGSVFAQLLEENFIPANTAMVRMRVFDEIGGFDEGLAVEDWDMWLRIAKRYEVGFIEEPLAYYRRHSSNLSRNSRTMSKATLDTLHKHIEHEVARRRFDRLLIQVFVIYVALIPAARTLLSHGKMDWLTARQCVKLALRKLIRRLPA